MHLSASLIAADYLYIRTFYPYGSFQVWYNGGVEEL